MRNAMEGIAQDLCLLLGTALLAGCPSVGRDFKRPAAPTVTGYTSEYFPPEVKFTRGSHQSLNGSQRVVEGLAIAPNWWTQFNSAGLNAAVELALRNSPTLAAAEATLRQTQKLYAAQSGSTFYPRVDANLGASRNKNNFAGFGGGGQSSSTYNLYSAGVAVAYNFDLFGGNRRELEALAAQTVYQEFQLAGARLTVAGNVVTTIFARAQLAEQVAVSEAILKAQQKQLDIAHKRFELGAIPRVEVLTLQTRVEQTRANVPALRNQVQQADHLLAVLTGQAPGEARLVPYTLADFSLPGELPLVVPSELVQMRPDIQASTALLHVATAQYGAAISKLYPHIELSAGVGAQALTLGALFGSGAIVWNLAAQISQPLFNRGLKPAASAAEANVEAAGANYQHTVLQALRSVADVLRQLDNDAQILAAASAATASAQEALELLEQQYEMGAASYIQLLTGQEQFLATRIGLISAQAARLADSAALYQAMGGGVLASTPALVGDKKR